MKKTNDRSRNFMKSAVILIMVLTFVAGASYFPALSAPVQAQTSSAPSENISDPGFSLFGDTICDGPPGDSHTKIPCDFKAFMREAQHLLNIAIIAGVVIAIFAFTWAGFLYITGGAEPAKRKEASRTFVTVFKGLIIMLAAWFIVYQVLAWLAKPGFDALLGGK